MKSSGRRRKIPDRAIHGTPEPLNERRNRIENAREKEISEFMGQSKIYESRCCTVKGLTKEDLED